MQLGSILIALALPLAELAVLIKLGQSIGVLWTLLVLVASALLGGLLVHNQGMSVMVRAMAAMREGRPPVGPMMESVLLMLAGVLFIIPGLLTDAAGAVLLLPPVRRWLAGRMLRNAVVAGSVHVEPDGDPRRPGEDERPRRPQGPGQVIEGEWERIDDPKDRR